MFALFTSETHTERSPLPAASAMNLRALLGAAAWSRLPQPVQRRFGIAHTEATYCGRMELRCSRMGRIFAALARCWGGPLTGISAADSPATVRVTHNGRGGVVWERCFHDDDTTSGRAPQRHGQTIRSTKELDADGRLLERTEGGLSMLLDVFEENGALVFQSRRYLWVLPGRRLRVRIPLLLTPGTCRVVHTDLGGGNFRFTLTMDHPWWGQTFYQSGVFADPHLEGGEGCGRVRAMPPHGSMRDATSGID
ncbi:MAG: DUF4166 domain-containing protein [Acidovorax sp.]